MNGYGRPPPDVNNMVSLKVDNLTYRTNADDLRRAFEKFGDVGDVYIPRDRFTRESRGFAFVRFYDRRDADDAMMTMDGKLLDGRELRVQMARYGRPASPVRRYGGGRYGGGSRRRSRSRSRSRDRGRRERHQRSRSCSASRSRSRTPQRSYSRSKSRSRSRSDSKSTRGRETRSATPQKSRSRSR